MNLTANFSAAIGTVSYNWTYSQATGAAISGTSLTNGSNPAVFTFPNTIVPTGVNSGTYSFVFQCQLTDSGVVGCQQVRTVTVYFNDVIPACSLVFSSITIS